MWRHGNGAKWRAVPAELGPWSRAAQLFIRWAKLDVWQRLLELVQARGVSLGMVFLDGTNVRAHSKPALDADRGAAGAAKKGAMRASEIAVKRLAAAVAGGACPRLDRGARRPA